MNTNLLDKVATLRWLSALIAVCYHVRFLLFCSYTQSRHDSIALDLFFFLSSLGREAFLVYMVLSGLLLGGLPQWGGAYRRADAWPALRRKVRKLYLVLVPALLVGGVLDAVGSQVFAVSGVYASLPQFAPGHLSPLVLVGNLLMLQDIAAPGYGSNAMLSLLAYECWACFAYGLVVLPDLSRRLAGFLLSCAVVLAIIVLQPQFLAYLAAWLAGFAVARGGWVARARVSVGLGAVFFVVAVLGSRFFGARLGHMAPALVLAGRTLLDLVLVLGLGTFLVSLHGSAARPKRLGKLKRAMVQLSLPMYAVHLPFVVFLVAAANAWLGVPLNAQPSIAGLAAFVLIVGASYPCAMLVARLAAGLGAALHRHRTAHAGAQPKNIGGA